MVDAAASPSTFEPSPYWKTPVLLALVHGGLARDDAYRIVQENAVRAWAEKRSFRDLLDADPRVAVPASLLDEAFDLKRSLRHSAAVFEAVDDLK